jgi:hypothetical protein
MELLAVVKSVHQYDPLVGRETPKTRTETTRLFAHALVRMVL